MRRQILWLTLVMVGSAVGGFLAVTVHSRFEESAIAQERVRLARAVLVADVESLGERFERVAEKVAPAVVAVDSTRTQAESGSGKTVEESGSGVLVRFDGRDETFVLTNHHVIAGASPDRIVITLANGRVLQGERVWSDPESDVAVVALPDVGSLPTASLGTSSDLKVGRWVLAIGSPFGLNQTVTHGIISAVGRGEVHLGSTIRIKDFIQTDAAINPGSSGGPLVNLDGEVIGINTAIASPSGSNSGIAFSIPIDLVRRVAGQLLRHGKVQRGYLGVQLGPGLEPTKALRLGLDFARGAQVEYVYADTPGDKAGLQAGDIITEFNGIAIRDETHLIRLISDTPPGESIELGVLRDGKKLQLRAVTGDWSNGRRRIRGADR